MRVTEGTITKPATSLDPSAGPFLIVFDGGAIGNPGKGYGSFEILQHGVPVHPVERREYGMQVTNNVAEYRTLIAALSWLAETLGERSREAVVEVRGDSQLVIFQVTGRWKIKKPHLGALASDVRMLMMRFKSVSLDWHPRIMSVRRLGH